MSDKIKLNYYSYNNMSLGYYEKGNGGFSVVNTISTLTHIEKELDSLPFLIDYESVDENGKTHYGYKTDFKLVSQVHKGETLTKVYYAEKSALEVVVSFYFTAGCDAVEASCKAINKGKNDIILKYLTSANLSGIFCDSPRPYENNSLKIVRFLNLWEGEAQYYECTLREAGVMRTSHHETRSNSYISSVGSQTTEKVLPILFFTDSQANKVWYIQYSPKGSWHFNLHLVDGKNTERSMFCVASATGKYDVDGFMVRLKPLKGYQTPKTVFGCTNGGIEQAVRQLNVHRRKRLKRRELLAPIVYNDFMNCLWANPNAKKTLRLLDAVQKLGVEYYCVDGGWYNQKNNEFGDCIGDWEIYSERFDGWTMEDLAKTITSKGLKAGIWFEIEVCSLNAKTAQKPDDWFLTRNGKRIMRSGRYFFDFTNPQVTKHLYNHIKRAVDAGFTYMKFDYNANIGYGIDDKNNDLSPPAMLEQHSEAVRSFYEKIGNDFPNVIMEGCASGGMRTDYNMLPHFDLQSSSDCEDYRKYPSIINGLLTYLPPEICGIWSYPYPQHFKERNNESFYLSDVYAESMMDGEQTIFNMINSFMGAMYLSGRLDIANQFNLNLIKEAIEKYKFYRPFIATSQPRFYEGFKEFNNLNGFAVQGLLSGQKVLLAVWRLKSEQDEVQIKIPNLMSAKMIYPNFKPTEYETSGEKLTVKLRSDYSARLFEINLK